MADTPFVNVPEILKSSAEAKGADYDQDAIKLSQLYDDQARKLIYAHLAERGLGRPRESLPVHLGMLRRIVDSLSVVYRTPAVRRLMEGSRELSDSNASAKALAQVYARMQVDTHWQVIDGLRNLYRTIAVVFAPSGPHRSVQVRVFEPFNLHRQPDVMAADVLDEDERFLLQIRDGTDESEKLYQAWLHQDDGSWRMHIVDGRGEMPEGIRQPYPGGVLPWGSTLPVMLVYDELPRGRAYLPIPQSRVSFALAIDALVADLQFLIQQEAHTMLALSSNRSGDVPTEIGPGKILKLSEDATLQALSLNPKIKETVSTIDSVVRYWLTSESIPGDEFRETPVVQTGAALRVRNRDLEARRQRQTPLAQIDERIAYEKIRAVHNHYAEEWGLPALSETAELRVQIGRAWQPSEPRELQDRFFKDIALGASSPIDYVMERDGCTRDEAIARWERVQEDLLAYPARQNPGAMVQDSGPLTALGPESATKVAGEFNPDIASSVEGASVSDAARRKMAPVVTPKKDAA